jgi:mono/diheme cytochrome c family protein
MKHIATLLLAGSLVATAEVTDADKAKLIAEGATVFPTCIACHGPDGTGLKPAPNMVFAPSLVGSKLALGDPEVFTQIVMKGIKKEGTEYMMVMAPLEASLDDAKLAAVLTYVRNSFGNEASAIGPDQVKEWRAKYADRKEPYSRAELAEFTKKHEEEAKKKAE